MKVVANLWYNGTEIDLRSYGDLLDEQIIRLLCLRARLKLKKYKSWMLIRYYQKLFTDFY